MAQHEQDSRVVAEVREQFGKGAARRLRAAGKIPAVIYGHGTEPRHVTLPGHQVALLLRKANAVLELDIQGDSQLALVKDVQKDPVRQIVEHIDLIVIRRGERVQVEVPVHLEGEPFADSVADLDTKSLVLEVEATHIPERVVVEIEGAEEGTQVLAGQIEIPSGAVLITDPEELVVNVHAPQKVDLGEEPETEEGEGDEAEGDEASDASEASTEE